MSFKQLNFDNKSGIFWSRAANALRIKYLTSKARKIKKQLSDLYYRASGRAVAAYWRNRDKRLATKRLWEKRNKERRLIQYKIYKLKNKLEKEYGHTLKK
jgi:hypothetical protein